jgi:hypothetical protein
VLGFQHMVPRTLGATGGVGAVGVGRAKVILAHAAGIAAEPGAHACAQGGAFPVLGATGGPGAALF